MTSILWIVSCGAPTHDETELSLHDARSLDNPPDGGIRDAYRSLDLGHWTHDVSAVVTLDLSVLDDTETPVETDVQFDADFKHESEQTADTFIAFDSGIASARDVGDYRETVSLDQSTPIQFNEAVFAATHNSYSGHSKGTILSQLNLGIRCLEFDFHDNDYTERQHYRVGHASPGGEVSFGDGNPSGEALRDWLSLVARWSDENPEHAPITILLDAKDNLRDNVSPQDGNLGRLNQMLTEVFGSKLYSADGFRRWPSVRALEGRIVIVLSGDRTTRRAYLEDEGQDPAVAVSAGNRVVSLHHDGGDRLWYWTGRLVDADVQWLHHGRYDTGRNPSVLFLDETWVVEVHRSHSRDRLFAAVGRYNDDGTLIWYEESELFDGRASQLSLNIDGGIRLRYENNSGEIWAASGRREGTRVVFSMPSPTEESLGDPASSRGVSVTSSDRFGGSNRTLAYRTLGTRVLAPIRYRQLMFSEYQSGDDDFLRASAEFAGFESGNRDAVRAFRETLITRIWSYDEGDSVHATPQLPATDEPQSGWYDLKMRSERAIDW